MSDGNSKENACLGKIVRGLARSVYGDQRVRDGSKTPPLYFKGTLLVAKREKNSGSFLTSVSEGKYLNVGPKDMHSIAVLLFQVNAAYTCG